MVEGDNPTVTHILSSSLEGFPPNFGEDVFLAVALHKIVCRAFFNAEGDVIRSERGGHLSISATPVGFSNSTDTQLLR